MALHFVNPSPEKRRSGIHFGIDPAKGIIMLNQHDVPALIAGKLPQIKPELRKNGSEVTVYQSVQALTDYTRRMAIEHDFKMVEKCMSLVGNIYDKGNTLVRNVIENVFVFSFSSIMSTCNIVEWRIVQSYMPSGLYNLYVQQVLKSRL